MTDGISIGLTGDKELYRKFKRLAEKDARRALAKGTRAGAKAMLPIVKARTPIKTGLLRANVKVRATKRSKRYVGATVTMRGGEHFQGKLFYAGFLEWGWIPEKRGSRSHHRSDRGSRTAKRVRPRLFMEKSAKSAWRMAVVISTNIIRTHIEQAAKR